MAIALQAQRKTDIRKTTTQRNAWGIRQGVLFAMLWMCIGMLGVQQSLAQERDQTLTPPPVATMAQTQVTENQIIEALGIDPDLVESVRLGSERFGDSDPLGSAVFSQTTSGFPTTGDSFFALSSGCAGRALDTDIDADVLSCALNDGPNGPGNATDLSQLELKLNVPAGANQLSFDFKFYSEEYPDFIGSPFNDGFVVEVGESTFTVDGSDLVAPDNQVFDEEGKPITINDTGVLGQNEDFAAGTAYGRPQNGGATSRLSTRIPIVGDQETITLTFSIFDVNDQLYESTVFVDNLEFVDAMEIQELDLIALEVNQAIQNWKNDIPLISKKNTIVRAHLQNMDPEHSTDATVRLEGMRNGQPLLGSPLEPVEANMELPPYIDPSSNQEEIAGRRADLEKSVNFTLPSSWLEGEVDLKLLGSNIQCPVTTIDVEDGCEVRVEFEPSATPRIIYFDIEVMGGIGPVNNPNEEFIEARNMFPMENLLLGYGGKIEFDDEPSSSRVLNIVKNKWIVDYLLGSVSRTDIYYGFVPQVSDTGTGGRAYLGGIPPFFGGGAGITVTSNDEPNTTSHELGHVFNRPHAVNEDENGTNKDGDAIGFCNSSSGHDWSDENKGFPNFRTPFYNETLVKEYASLGSNNVKTEKEIWGLDTHNNVALGDFDKAGKKGVNAEIMSYCYPSFANYHGKRWTSDETYRLVLDYLIEKFDKIETENIIASTEGSSYILDYNSNSEVKEYKLVRGLIDRSYESLQDGLSFEPFIRIDAPLQKVTDMLYDNGSFIMEAVSEGGDVSWSTSFEAYIIGKETSLHSFIVPIPEDIDFNEVRVLHKEDTYQKSSATEIGSISASPNAPEIYIEDPDEGETMDGSEITISWSGDDPDGGELTYHVYYSTDGGVKWETLALDRSQTNYTIALDDLAGTSNGAFRVQASDGFNTSDSVVDGLTVPGSPPRALIQSPADGFETNLGSTVTLRGTAQDREDGRLEGNALEWNSDLDGTLGTGSVVDVPASTLSQGVHTITLRATDSDGQTDETSITIEMVRPRSVTTQPDDPQVINSIPNQRLVPDGAVFERGLDDLFLDPTDEGLTYDVSSSDETVATVSLENGELIVTTGEAGIAEITVSAANEAGETRIVFNVIVGNPPEPIDTINNQELDVEDDPFEIDLGDVFSDPTDSGLSFTVSSSADTIAVASVEEALLAVEPVGVGQAEVTVTAANEEAETSLSFNVVVVGDLPEVVEPISDQALQLGGEAFTQDLDEVFSDPVGDGLAYAVAVSHPSVVEAEVSGATLALNATGAGMSEVTLSATASTGAAADLSFTVSVEEIVLVTSRTFGDPTDERSYRLVGLAGATDIAPDATLTGTQGETWRLFRETGGDGESAEDYLEEYDGSDAFRFAPGRGFWLLSREGWEVDQTVDAVELSGDGFTTVPLHEGWNIFSNPLDQPVGWNATLGLEANDGLTEALWQWDGGWQGADTLQSARTGEAYYLFNDGDLEVLTLQHPAFADEDEQGDLLAATEAERAELQLIAETRSAETDERQEAARLAVGHTAGEAIMHRLPPAHFAAAQLSVRSELLDAPLGRLLKAAPEAGEGLAFDVELTGLAEGEAAYLYPEGLSAFEGEEVVLVHTATGARHTLADYSAAEPLRIRVEEGHLTRGGEGEKDNLPLQLLIGDQAFVDGAAERPDELAFGAVYPNPSDGQVTIEVAVPETMALQVELYNVLGQQVGLLHSGELAPGVHELRWDGRTTSGAEAASGVYLLRLMGPDGQQDTARLTRVR